MQDLRCIICGERAVAVCEGCGHTWCAEHAEQHERRTGDADMIPLDYPAALEKEKA